MAPINRFKSNYFTSKVCVKLSWLHILVFILFGGSFGEVRYSVPEEMARGSVIGNVARDLGLNVAELRARRARIVAEGTRQLCELDAGSGFLLVSERIDREELCAQAEVCVLQYQLLLEDPLKVYSLVLDIQDVNDNSPAFATGITELELVESTVPGRRFPLESAHDPDLGTNTVRVYKLSPNDHFALELNTQLNENAYPELVLKKTLDRETQAEYTLTINGIDGGNPARTGTASILIRILDANDNVPIFNQRVYKTSVLENSVKGALVASLNATDLDDGVYGDVTYSFSRMSDKSKGLFVIDHVSGEVTVAGPIDYEEASAHELDVQAKDGGGQASHCKLIIEVIDVNDNEPVITVKSASTTVAEDSKPGTMVALLNVYDLDTGNSGRVTCVISDGLPFKLISEVKSYYMLLTDGVLDREMYPQYNITITAIDAGSPSLSSSKLVHIVVSDINDNPPVFTRNEYSTKVWENQPRGTFLTRVIAEDLDAGSNSKLLYTLSEDTAPETSSFVSINSETGELYTSRPFDYEQSVYYQVHVTARDGGDPPLSSTCTVRIFVGDQNDNAPIVLYPVQSTNYIADDMVPLEAPKGYLVTKVVALDADSGHNAWLSYRVIKATQPNLFNIGLHCGEIRTLRPFLEEDEQKQMLVILVKDNGPDSLSATATVNVLIDDGLPVLSELFEIREDQQASENLTLYLILALVTVSSLLLILISTVTYYKVCRRGYVYRAATSSLPVFPSAYGPPSYTDVSRCGTLFKDDRYDSFLTTGSWKGDFRFGSSLDTDTLKKRSAVYQKNNTLRRMSAERAAGLKVSPVKVLLGLKYFMKVLTSAPQHVLPVSLTLTQAHTHNGIFNP